MSPISRSLPNVDVEEFVVEPFSALESESLGRRSEAL